MQDILGGVIDVQQLRALVELSRLGTVSAAADSLGFSQSTVSHQLAALSRATGAVLLTRAGRGVRLTEEGRALAARRASSWVLPSAAAAMAFCWQWACCSPAAPGCA